MAKGDLNNQPSPMTQQAQATMGQSGIQNSPRQSMIGVPDRQMMNSWQNSGSSFPYGPARPGNIQQQSQSGYGGIPFMGMQGINNLTMRYPMLAQQGYNGNNNSFAQSNPFANRQMPIMKMPMMNNQPSAASPFQQWQGSAGGGMTQGFGGQDRFSGLKDMLSKIYNPQPNPNIGPIDYSKTYEDYNRDYHADDRDAVLGGYNRMLDPGNAHLM